MRSKFLISLVSVVILLSMLLPVNGIALGTKSLEDDFENIVVKAIESQKSSANIQSLKISANDINRVSEMYHDVLDRNPQLFYVTGASTLYYDKYITEMKFEYSYKTNEISKMKKEFDSRTKEALKFVNSKMSTAEQALAMYDYLILQNSYDQIAYETGNYSKESHSAYGGLVKRLAVCDGYSKAYAHLMNNLGIPVMVVRSDSMNHSWNMVKIDKKWYHVDVTWGDPICKESYGFVNDDHNLSGYVDHSYFLVSDEKIKNLKHYGWSSDAPKATSKLFDNIWVKDISSGMFNVNGKWYYRDAGDICVSNWTRSGEKILFEADSSGKFYDNLGLYANRLYFNSGNQICNIDLNGKNLYRIIDVSEKELSSPYLYEFNILSGKLYYGVQHLGGYKTFSKKL